jgi:acetylserotonin O-methyltransferase
MTTSREGPEIVLDLIDAFRRSKTMFTAVSLGIFDQLHDRACTAAEVAAALAADTGAVERLLDGCAGLGLLVKDGSEYRNSAAAGTYLRRGSPHTLSGYVLYSDRALYRLWGSLEDAVREGTHRWGAVFGGKDALFANFFATDDAKREFLAGMHGVGLLSSQSIVASFDLSRFRRLVDLGGGTGHLAVAAVDRYPHLRAAVFDLPEVGAITRGYVADRAEVLAGDFFTDPLPEADLYVLGRILHDWPADKITLLLENIFNSLLSGGAVLIAEKLLYEDKSGPLPALLQSLNMLVCTKGRERTLSEYQELLYSAGFTHVEGRRTGTPLDAILAVK